MLSAPELYSALACFACDGFTEVQHRGSSTTCRDCVATFKSTDSATMGSRRGSAVTSETIATPSEVRTQSLKNPSGALPFQCWPHILRDASWFADMRTVPFPVGRCHPKDRCVVHSTGLFCFRSCTCHDHCLVHCSSRGTAMIC